MRELYTAKDERPQFGVWFEERLQKYAGSNPNAPAEKILVLCQTSDRGNTVVESIASDEDKRKFAAEYVAFEKSKGSK